MEKVKSSKKGSRTGDVHLGSFARMDAQQLLSPGRLLCGRAYDILSYVSMEMLLCARSLVLITESIPAPLAPDTGDVASPMRP